MSDTPTPDPQRWLQEYGGALFGFAMRQVSDRELAADLVQETLLAGWRNRAGFRGQSKERTWLIGILQHKITDHIRRAIREREFSSQAKVDPTDPWFAPNGAWLASPSAWRAEPSGALDRQRMAEQIDRCLQQLPQTQRLVFCAREMTGEATSAICKRLELTTTNLHVLMHRARLGLRRCLEEHGYGG
ncbi:MAG: sigma-70 family RNA polymerase sigma factor [Mariprofundales bacterium]|nr:sigma-70 family RNA polymerase sigma factor [Mariprofundales bacterium]